MNEPITIIVEDAYEVCYYVANGITFDCIKDIDPAGRFLCRFILTSERQAHTIRILKENLKDHGAFINLADLRMEIREIREKMDADLKRLTRIRDRRVRV